MTSSLDRPPDPLHIVFLALLPRIERHGRVYFRHVKDPARKEEFIAEMVGLAWKWCRRLAQRDKDVLRFPMPPPPTPPKPSTAAAGFATRRRARTCCRR